MKKILISMVAISLAFSQSVAEEKDIFCIYKKNKEKPYIEKNSIAKYGNYVIWQNRILEFTANKYKIKFGTNLDKGSIGYIKYPLKYCYDTLSEAKNNAKVWSKYKKKDERNILEKTQDLATNTVNYITNDATNDAKKYAKRAYKDEKANGKFIIALEADSRYYHQSGYLFDNSNAESFEIKNYPHASFSLKGGYASPTFGDLTVGYSYSFLKDEILNKDSRFSKYGFIADGSTKIIYLKDFGKNHKQGFYFEGKNIGYSQKINLKNKNLSYENKILTDKEYFFNEYNLDLRLGLYGYHLGNSFSNRKIKLIGGISYHNSESLFVNEDRTNLSLTNSNSYGFFIGSQYKNDKVKLFELYESSWIIDSSYGKYTGEIDLLDREFIQSKFNYSAKFKLAKDFYIGIDSGAESIGEPHTYSKILVSSIGLFSGWMVYDSIFPTFSGETTIGIPTNGLSALWTTISTPLMAYYLSKKVSKEDENGDNEDKIYSNNIYYGINFTYKFEL